MTEDDVWHVTYRLTGDADLAESDVPCDEVLDRIDALREDRDHLLGQLRAARAQLALIYPRLREATTLDDVRSVVSAIGLTLTEPGDHTTSTYYPFQGLEGR